MNCLFDGLEQYSGRTALIADGGEQLSYKELLSAADIIGGQVKGRALVVVICRNCAESLAGYVGFLRRGAVVILIDDGIDPVSLNGFLESYQPAYLFLPTDPAEIRNSCSAVFRYGRYVLLRTGYADDHVMHDDLALLLATSGTINGPQLVRLSYKNLISNAAAIARYLPITDDDRAVTTMPMSYAYGLSIINTHLFKGAAMILTDLPFTDGRFWGMLKDFRGTTFGGVPYCYEMLKTLRFGNMDLPDLRYITQAGGKLNPELVLEFVDICARKDIRFFVMYGQTEATARMAYLPWESARSKAGSIGQAISGGRFWLADNNGNAIHENGRLGELVYEGDNVALGYAEDRRDLCRADDNHGILYTGDMAKRDTDGFYYIVGRKKRFVDMFGSSINLDEVEQFLRDQGLDCACIGADGILKVYVAGTGDSVFITDILSGRTGLDRSGIAVVSVDNIPRNGSHKVMYSMLRAL